MPFADLATGARFYYDELGTGEPLVLVHGLLGTAEIDLAEPMKWLGTRYHVYGPSLRGYGESTPKPRDFPLNFYHRDASDLLAFLDALNLPKVHLLGYSDGGEAALVAAGMQPERFWSVAVIGAVGSFTPAVRPRIQSLYPGNWITDDQKRLHGIENADAFILAWIKAMKYMIDTGGDVSLGLAQNITCPLLIMLGKTDALNPAEYAQQFIERALDGRLEMFECGHAVHHQLWNDFQRVYGDFLKAIPM